MRTGRPAVSDFPRVDPMCSAICEFCKHCNPVSSKFCNDCGSPLQLKPCRHCDAVNDCAAGQCYQCGAELPAQSEAPTPTLSEVEGTPWISSSATIVSESATLAVTPVASSLEFPISAADAPDRWSRVSVYAVVVIVAAISAYSIYRDLPQLKQWLADMKLTPGITAAAESKGIRLNASDSNGELTQPNSPAAGMPTAIQIGAESKPNGSASAPADQVTARGSIGGDAAARLLAATSALPEQTSANPATAAQSVRETRSTTISSKDASQAPSDPAVVSSSVPLAAGGQKGAHDRRADNEPAMPRMPNCTKAVAALGFCDPGSTT